jgi:hypothetical protein
LPDAEFVTAGNVSLKLADHSGEHILPQECSIPDFNDKQKHATWTSSTQQQLLHVNHELEINPRRKLCITRVTDEGRKFDRKPRKFIATIIIFQHFVRPRLSQKKIKRLINGGESLRTSHSPLKYENPQCPNNRLFRKPEQSVIEMCVCHQELCL